jgi:hypothetical protein
MIDYILWIDSDRFAQWYAGTLDRGAPSMRLIRQCDQYLTFNRPGIRVHVCIEGDPMNPDFIAAALALVFSGEMRGWRNVNLAD